MDSFTIRSLWVLKNNAGTHRIWGAMSYGASLGSVWNSKIYSTTGNTPWFVGRLARCTDPILSVLLIMDDRELKLKCKLLIGKLWENRPMSILWQDGKAILTSQKMSAKRNISCVLALLLSLYLNSLKKLTNTLQMQVFWMRFRHQTQMTLSEAMWC
jgi:hypothetical protein